MDNGYETEQREKWAESNSPSTVQFVAEVQRCPVVIAVLAGHIHTSKADPCGLGNAARQYVTAAGCDGGQRRIDFVPLKEQPRL